MLNKLSDEQFCYPGSNLSCIRAQFTVGAQVCLYVVFVLDIVANIVGNTLVILSIGHFKQLHSPTNMLLLSLAFCDLLVGVTIIPFSMRQTVQGCWFYGDTFCLFHSSTDTFLCYVSILHLVCIAVDRHEAVCNPLRYTNKLTMSVAWLMVLVCWVVAALSSYILICSKAKMADVESVESINCLGSCNIFIDNIWGILTPIIQFYIPCAVMVGLYTKIFLVSKEHLRKIKDSNQGAHVRGSKRSEQKAAKTLGIVVGVFIFCWFPYFLTSIIALYTDLSKALTLYEVFNWLTYFNSTMNPIIYSLFYPWFRKCVSLIATLKIFKQNSSDINVFT